MFKKIAFSVTIIFSFICVEVMAADAVGTVIAAQGQVYAVNSSGTKRLLERRSEFYLQEVIATEGNSTAQLKLKDDTIISLKPSTKYSVSDFNLDAKDPKNNRYVGKLVEGVLISLSGQGKNSTHDNHQLKTPVVTIAIRGTLYETGFKTKKYSHKAQGIANTTLGIGWASVEDGAVAVRGGGKEFDINAKDLSNNACFITAAGRVDKRGRFKVSPKVAVAITPMSDKQMRGLVTKVMNAPSNENIISIVPTSSVTTNTGSTSANSGVSQIVVAPVTPQSEAIVSTVQQSSVSAASGVSGGGVQIPVIVPEPLPTPPVSPGRPTGNGV